MNDFYQEPPELDNQYLQDPVLQRFLMRVLPHDILQAARPQLERLGHRAVTDLNDLAQQAELQQPRHVPYDPWGRRVDHIEVSPAWDALKRVSAQEGLVAMGYEQPYGAYSRVCQFSLLYLFHPSSAVFSCPLAMTDGAARALQIYGRGTAARDVFSHFTSRDPERFWTSGQWMTERTGGSDVRGTSTIAKPQADGSYRLYGAKWFTSATTSEIAMTLARIQTKQTAGDLSLFYLKLKDGANRLNRIQIHRLKHKLGTQALPTAELSLIGSEAHLVGSPGDGVKKISAQFNITRIYNAVCAVGTMRRGLALARSYAAKRKVFGKLLIHQPLHQQTLAHLEVVYRGNFLLTFQVAGLLGEVEAEGGNDESKSLLRLLTPVAKLYTAKQGVDFSSEILECFGGAGYVEDTGLPRLLRDAQVLSIWEGTTNVLSLDTLRALGKGSAFDSYFKAVKERLSRITERRLGPAIAVLEKRLQQLLAQVRALAEFPLERVEMVARALAFNLAEVFAGSLLAEQAQWEAEKFDEEEGILVVKHWIDTQKTPLFLPDDRNTALARRLFRDPSQFPQT